MFKTGSHDHDSRVNSRDKSLLRRARVSAELIKVASSASEIKEACGELASLLSTSDVETPGACWAVASILELLGTVPTLL